MQMRRRTSAKYCALTPMQRGGGWKTQKEGRSRNRPRMVQTGVPDVAVEHSVRRKGSGRRRQERAQMYL